MFRRSDRRILNLMDSRDSANPVCCRDWVLCKVVRGTGLVMRFKYKRAEDKTLR